MIGIEKLFLKTLITVTYCERDESSQYRRKDIFLHTINWRLHKMKKKRCFLDIGNMKKYEVEVYS